LRDLKSDHADAMTLANILRVDAHLHRRLPVGSELCQAITVLARAHQDAIWRRIKAHNELRSLLREFFPTCLAAVIRQFAPGIASPEARAILGIAPTSDAAGVGKSEPLLFVHLFGQEPAARGSSGWNDH
jgi:hypothetical protein